MNDFLQAAPGATARRITNRDLSGKATPSEVRWLYDNPALWARALRELLTETQRHTSKARLRLAQHPERPKAATHPTPAYLEAVADVKRLEMSRDSFRQKVEVKLRDVATLLGSSRLVDALVVGDLIVKLHDIAYLIEGNDAEGARRLAVGFAELLLKEGQS